MRWYADNSELNGARGTDIPDMLLFGGVAIPPDCDVDFRNSIEEIKAKYGHPRAPIKWNFKDLKKLYETQKMEALYQRMLASSKDWRAEIFEASLNFDYKIIIACVQCHSVQRKVIKGVKPDLTKFTFSNGLMRVALHAQETRPDRYQIILDWPDQGDSSPFDMEYASAYKAGVTKDGNVPYHSGALKDLGFMDSVVYTNMKHSTILQFADLVVGASREFIECAIGKKETGFGLDMAKLVAKKYRGHEQKAIFGRGISIASGDVGFRKQVKEYIITELQIA